MPQVFRGGEWIDVEYVPPSEWPLPPPASLFWRLPVIRHVRWFCLSRRMAAWHSMWLSLGYFPNEYDMRVLDAIWSGDA
jgi:hypothetical protein